MTKKIKNPSSFSEMFKVNADELTDAGVLDPVLNVDTKLFIDPLLLSASLHKEIKKDAVASYTKRFTQLVTLLAGSNYTGDTAWRTAQRLLDFPEITGTCLGYGAASIRGRSWGHHIRDRVLTAAKETIDLGVRDPDLFMVVALLEDGVGPDLISDMTTNIILRDLEKFNARICASLKVKTELFTLPNGARARFPRNPLVSGKPAPVILVPIDILRDLPIATSWGDVGYAAAKNSALRRRVNTLIGEIWEARVRKSQKDAIRRNVYSSKEAFEAILDAIREVPALPYDSTTDPNGHLAWMLVHHTVAKAHPLKLSLSKNPSIDEVHAVVTQIIDHYRELVENKGLWKELWTGTKRRPEKSAQRIFFAVADSYCRANELDITPEADSGSGPVEFKVSSSYKNRVLVELKLSTNTKVVAGYEKQLSAYKKAEGTTRASYMVIDVGGMGGKDTRLIAVKNATVARGEPASVIEFVKGEQQQSASKL
jgi:hypothetical protein